MRPEFLPFHRPSIGDEEVQEVVETLRSGWLTSGPRVRRFEADFASYVGASHAVATNSCTAALHLALAAVGIKPGDEVVVPTMTFTATAAAVLHLGARPVFVDCLRDTFNLDEQRLEEKITPKTRALIPVHMAGQPCEMDAVQAIAETHDLRVVEDAAHALPTRYRGRMIGTIGDITTFSFYATKTITTGEGGMASTENTEYAEHMRRLSLHGISTDAWKRYAAEGTWYYEVLEAGYKYNMTDIAAAMGIHQLRRAGAFRERRRQIAERYDREFCQMEATIPPFVRTDVEHSWHLYVILLNLEHLTIDRSRFIEELRARNVGASVHFIPLHLHPFYQRVLGYHRGEFPNAEWVYERCVSLPIYPDLSDQDVDHVIEAVRDIVRTWQR